MATSIYQYINVLLPSRIWVLHITKVYNPGVQPLAVDSGLKYDNQD